MAKQSGSGGGARVTEYPVRTGAGSRSTNPAGVNMLGNIQGSHVTRGEDGNYRGEPLHSGRSFQPSAFGNEIAARTVCGPGGSREVMRSGGQGTHGGTNPGSAPAKNRDILSGYGPESRSRSSNPGRRFSDTDADY